MEFRNESGERAKARMFLIYHDPRESSSLDHSIGLAKGKIAVVNVFGVERLRETNNVIIAHELMHILGASDKYGSHNIPIFPDGGPRDPINCLYIRKLLAR